MKADKRACFAVVAATLVNKRAYNGVYDCHQSKHLTISTSNANTSNPEFYDHNRNHSVSGNDKSMYDYATSSHVSINVTGSTVDCYDYETSSSITFNVNGNNVDAYDFETSSNYSYCVD